MNKQILIDATNVVLSIPGGGSFCTEAYIEAFLALFPGRVDVLHPEEAHIKDSRYTTIDVPQRNWTQRVIGFFKGQFHRSGQYLVDYLRAHCDEYQMVMISTGLYAGGIVDTIRAMGIQVVVLHHNYEPEFRMASKSILTLKGQTDFIVRYWERKGYLGADINLFLTKQDKAKFEQEYGVHPRNFVTGIFETKAGKQKIANIQTSKSAAITCALGDIQNQAPLLRFAEVYLPIFHDLLPDWSVRIMGRNPSPAIQNMANQHDSITLIPNPTDIRSLAAESAIYLCPMDIGGGLKLRLMDGLRTGRPVLVHERAARGYDALIGEPFFYIYNNPKSFEKGLKQLVHYTQSPDYSRSAIQDKYYELFSLEAGIKRLQSVLCE